MVFFKAKRVEELYIYIINIITIWDKDCIVFYVSVLRDNRHFFTNINYIADRAEREKLAKAANFFSPRLVALANSLNAIVFIRVCRPLCAPALAPATAGVSEQCAQGFFRLYNTIKQRVSRDIIN